MQQILFYRPEQIVQRFCHRRVGENLVRKNSVGLLRQRGWQYHAEAGRGGAEGGVGTESTFRMAREH